MLQFDYKSGIVAHACDPSYPGSIGRGLGSMANLGQKHETLSRKITEAKKCWEEYGSCGRALA
jgi:hypothetical protein